MQQGAAGQVEIHRGFLPVGIGWRRFITLDPLPPAAARVFDHMCVGPTTFRSA
jgi:hypothetical protein